MGISLAYEIVPLLSEGQVVMNLGTNAAHAMQEKGGVLEFDLRDEFVEGDFAARYPEIQPGPFLKFTVSDTGHGMVQEIIDHIFEPFYTTKANDAGTGMGLSVVHGIVSSCGGMITVSSEPDQGSSFSVFLPSIKSPSEFKKNRRFSFPWATRSMSFLSTTSHRWSKWDIRFLNLWATR